MVSIKNRSGEAPLKCRQLMPACFVTSEKISVREGGVVACVWSRIAEPPKRIPATNRRKNCGRRQSFADEFLMARRSIRRRLRRTPRLLPFQFVVETRLLGRLFSPTQLPVRTRQCKVNPGACGSKLRSFSQMRHRLCRLVSTQSEFAQLIMGVRKCVIARHRRFEQAFRLSFGGVVARLSFFQQHASHFKLKRRLLLKPLDSAAKDGLCLLGHARTILSSGKANRRIRVAGFELRRTRE